MQQNAPWENDKPVSQGATPWEADKPVTEEQGSAPPSRHRSVLDGVALGMEQGVTLGASDEMVSGALAGTVGLGKGVFDAWREKDLGAIPRGMGDVYRGAQDMQRKEHAEIRQQQPITTTGAQIGSGIATGIASGAKLLAGQAGKALVAGSGALGVAEGGAAGFFGAEGDAQERLKSAGQGAAIGGALGAGSTALAQGASQFWRARKSGVKIPTIERKRFELIRDALAKDQGSRAKAEAFLRKWATSGADPNELFDEMGTAGRAMYREIARRSDGPAMAFVNDWKSTLSGNIRDKVSDTLSTTGQRVPAIKSKLQEIRAVKVKPLYDEAYAYEIPVDVYNAKLRPILRERATRGGLNRAKKLIDAEIVKAMREDPQLIPELRDTRQMFDNWTKGQEVVLNTRAMDYIARGLASAEQSAMRAQGSADIARAVGGVRRTLRDTLRQYNPKYGEALDTFSDVASVDRAFEASKDFLSPRMSADDLRETLAGMTKSERDFYKVGVADQFERVIDNTRIGRNEANLVVTPNLEKKLMALYGDDPDGAKEFIRFMRQNAEGFSKRSALSAEAGSQTQPRAAAAQDFDDAVEGPMTRAGIEATKKPTQVFGQIAEIARNGRRAKISEELADMMSKTLFEGQGMNIPAPPTALPPAEEILRLNGGTVPLLEDRTQH